MENYVLIGLLILSVVIIIITVLLIVYYSFDTPANNTVGEACMLAADCSTGLTCKGGLCVIPQTGACTDYPNFCETGTVCMQSKCIPINPDKGGTCNRKLIKLSKELESVVHPNPKNQTPQIFSKLFASKLPNIQPTQLNFNGDFSNMFFMNGIIYLLSTDGKSIGAYDLSGNKLKCYFLNTQLTTDKGKSYLEVKGDTVSTIIDDNLYTSKIPDVSGGDFTFSKVQDNVTSLGTDYYGNNLVFPYGKSVAGGESMLSSNGMIQHTQVNGTQRQITMNGNENPIVYAGKIFYQKNPTKAYLKPNAYSYYFSMQ